MRNYKIANVAIPLPIDKLFDYYIPKRLEKKANKGTRVYVKFNHKITVGYIVSLSFKSKFNKLNPILNLLDAGAIFTETSVKLANKVRNYFPCSLGEMLDVMLLSDLKKSKKLKPLSLLNKNVKNKSKSSPIYSQYYNLENIINYIFKEIEKVKLDNKRALIVVAEIQDIDLFFKKLSLISGLKVGIWHGRLSKNETIQMWSDLAGNLYDVIIGTRSCLFAPVQNLDLIIVMDEDDYAHKDDQVPYYHAVKVAQLRSELEKARLILTSQMPSLETFQEIYKKRYSTNAIEAETSFAKIQLCGINFKDKIDLILENELQKSLENKQKILIFLNRRGFATSIFCKKCNKALKCNRCSRNLRYEYAQKKFICPCCNFKTDATEICPDCNSSYIKYSGIGVEKLESHIKRIFPSNSIITIEEYGKDKNKEFDILISSKIIINYGPLNFDTIIIWDFDSLLNIGDFQSGEHTFALLAKLLIKAKSKMIICSSFKNDFYLFKDLQNLNFPDFYKRELASRKSLRLPPYYNIGLISIRGLKKDRVHSISSRIYGYLDSQKNNAILDPKRNSDQISKKRGKYYSFLVVKAKNCSDLTRIISNSLTKFKSSDVIITTNIDPIEI